MALLAAAPRLIPRLRRAAAGAGHAPHEGVALRRPIFRQSDEGGILKPPDVRLQAAPSVLSAIVGSTLPSEVSRIAMALVVSPS